MLATIQYCHVPIIQLPWLSLSISLRVVMAVLDFELLSKPLILFCFYIGDGLSKAFLLKHAICHYDPSFKTFGLDLLMCNES